MIANPTILIVGAGASVELGYPTAAELREWIIRGMGMAQFGSQSDGRLLSWRLQQSLIPSIDAFLAEDENADLRKWGKFCIAGALLPCEGKRKGFPPDWLRAVFNAVRGKKSEERTHKLKIITFNYDLSIEHFLTRAFLAAYKLQNLDAARKMFDESIEVIHVYGQLGKILEQGQGREYGRNSPEEVDANDIIDCAESLKIIGRSPNDSAFDASHRAIAEAEFIAVLGFGYDETNVANLKLAELAGERHVFSTAYGMGYGTRAWIREMGMRKTFLATSADGVTEFLANSSFLRWANTPGKTAAEMYGAISEYFRGTYLHEGV